ncbi:hypothetical protein AZI86_16370 [Bdellovibrio bacteriovorus]|uniref:Uncharacterized protein n=1 Tax=Bdellovibrio bacteriovorus TaxID=959 RepID=A0A150WHA4_BDEBC|nr:hypothetical protein AZI86_16370 [Bdellovibrio bacteriovorus]
MNFDFGTFALRQMLNSLAVIGPLLIITGLSFYLFKENRRSIYVYLLLGASCTIIGAVCLIQEFKSENLERPEQVEPARK